MKRHLSLVFLSVFSFSALAMAKQGLKGQGAVVLASALHSAGVLSQATWGKSVKGDMEKFFAGVTNGAKCSEDAFKNLDLRLQAGTLTCIENSRYSFENKCILQSRDGKTVESHGAVAYSILSLAKAAGASVKANKDGSKSHTLKSVDCMLQGWSVCKDLEVSCTFP
ncbi:MAG: hypothetical protein ACK5Y2_04400 [Bdellovibrionales bacterium]